MAEVVTTPTTLPREIPRPNANLIIPPSGNAPLLQPSQVTRYPLSPVTVQGSFEFDRILKSGEVLKRTRKTKSWKSVFIVLRPNILSIYRDSDETKLRHQITLSELTAVARQKDPKRKDKCVFGLFSPSRNYHLEARTEEDAQEWVELIRREARFDEHEEEIQLASPGGHASTFRGFERSIDEQISLPHHETTGYSSSDAEALYHPTVWIPKQRQREAAADTRSSRRPSHFEYSGAEHGSVSDFSDIANPPAARMSALSLSHTDGRPSTSSNQRPAVHSIYGPSPSRPAMAARSASQMSNIGGQAQDPNAAKTLNAANDEERVIYQGWIYLLKTTSGVRQWKKVWMVLRPKALALYKDNDEYTAQLVIPFASIIDVVEIDPISKSKTACMQVIGEERNFRLCAYDEETLANWLGAFKSLLAKRKALGSSTTTQVT